MSVPFSTTSSDTPSRGYLRALALGVAIWLGLFLIFTWTVDPYGVSPTQLALRGINTQKPKRVDIDRLIKPYEVWRYQPRTVFLGTSRVHQSLDPAVLDGTRFALPTTRRCRQPRWICMPPICANTCNLIATSAPSSSSCSSRTSSGDRQASSRAHGL